MSDMSWMSDFAASWDAMTPEQQAAAREQGLKDKIAEEFGAFAVFLDHPEIGPLLRNAAQNGWTEQKMLTELRKTAWWKATNQAQRDWDALEAGDVSEANKQIGLRETDIQGIIAKYNGKLSPEQIRRLARRSLRNGMAERELEAAVGAEMVRSGNTTRLRQGLLGQTITAAAKSYGVPMSTQSINAWVEKVAQGSATLEDVGNYVRTQARGLYPGLTEDIDRGLTVEQVADPYREVAARTLGINPVEVDFSDAKWNRALNTVGSDGKRRMMTLAEWGDTIRKDSRYNYDQSEEAVSKAYEVANALANTFGKV